MAPQSVYSIQSVMSIENNIYLPIKQADTVFTKILDKVYSDTSFQKNITRLESGADKDKKKALIIKKTLSKIRVYGSIEQPLLLARDVGILMGISNIRLQLKFYNSSEKVMGMYQFANGKLSPVEYLTWKGFIRAASNSRSSLSDLFREFIYELVAEAIGDTSLLDKISKRVVAKNPELVDAALNELDTNLECYRLLYEKEALRNHLLQDGLDAEIQRRMIAEHDKATAELDALSKSFELKKLTEYTNKCEVALLDYYSHPSTEVEQLAFLKKKYMKPLYIYAPSSDIYNEIQHKKESHFIEFTTYIPEYIGRINYIQMRHSQLSRTSNYDDMAIMDILVPNSDYFYLYLSTTKLQGSEYILVHIDYYTDKRHIDSVIDDLNNNFEKISFKKKCIYYISIDDIIHSLNQSLIT